MYAAFWRFLPGPVWLKLFEFIIILAGFIYLLFYYIYPWVATLLPEPGSVVG